MFGPCEMSQRSRLPSHWVDARDSYNATTSTCAIHFKPDHQPAVFLSTGSLAVYADVARSLSPENQQIALTMAEASIAKRETIHCLWNQTIPISFTLSLSSRENIGSMGQ